ncbi:hypothetical protein ACLBYM_16790 [Methylobacterium fujisawaense]
MRPPTMSRAPARLAGAMLLAACASSPASAVSPTGGELAQAYWAERYAAGDRAPLLNAEVPVVACPLVSMADDVPPPKTPASVRVLVPEGSVGALAFFTTTPDAKRGVLGPRAWSCHAQSGSNGDVLYVVPPDAVPDRVNGAYAGPMVSRRFADGGTSGRFEVGRVAGRLFPQARRFAEQVRDEGLDDPRDFVFSPWPQDRLQRLSSSVVAYSTPGGAQGLGRPGKAPYGPETTSGVVMFDGISDDDPFLVELTVRLGDGEDRLAAAIVTGFLARLNVPAASASPPAPVSPAAVAASGGEPAMIVRSFYEALGRADGRSASGYVVPERRVSGPYSPEAISRFYASLAEPLRVVSIRPLDGSDVEARYRYRKGSGAICDGAAVATVSRTAGGTFIARIKPLNGC